MTVYRVARFEVAEQRPSVTHVEKQAGAPMLIRVERWRVARKSQPAVADQQARAVGCRLGLYAVERALDPLLRVDVNSGA